MGIGDRFTQIAKSYLNSAQESLSDEWDELGDKWDKGELGDEIMNRLKDLKKGFESSSESKEELSDADVQRILKENGFDTFDFQGSPEGNQRTRKRPLSKTKQDKLDEAYKRLNVSSRMTLKQIEKAYKKEMRKYHPDRFPNDEAKAKTATKVSQMLSEAYQLIKDSKSK